MHTLMEFYEYEKLGIAVKDYGDFVLLNYDMPTDKFHPVVRECRGLIRAKDGTVLCRPMDRFFNLGEEEFPFDPNGSVLEKLDGSLINFWYYNDEWHCASRNMAFCEGTTPLGNSWRDLIFKTIGFRYKHFIPGYTFSFEFVSPETQVVKKYSEPGLYLLNIRDNRYGLECGQQGLESWAKQYGFKTPKSYNLNSFEECMSSMSALPERDEGYVVRGDGWRLKVKNPAYVALHRLRNNGVLTPKRIAEMVWTNEHEEYLLAFPEDMDKFTPYLDELEDIILVANIYYDQYKHLDRRSYYEGIKNKKLIPFCMNLYSGKNIFQGIRSSILL